MVLSAPSTLPEMLYEIITFKMVHHNYWTSSFKSYSSTYQLKLMFVKATANRSIYFSLT